MKINNTLIGQSLKIEERKATFQNQADSSTKGKKAETKDQVSLSNSSKLFAKASEAIAAAPDIRSEKVAAIKALVDSGTYRISSSNLAEAILKDFNK